MSRAPNRASKAFWTLQLVTEHAPEPARVAFRSELRAMGLRAPGDPDAPATAVPADARPDLFARAAAAVVMPWLDGPSAALAAAAISTLMERPARRSPASEGVAEGEPEDGP